MTKKILDSDDTNDKNQKQKELLFDAIINSKITSSENHPQIKAPSTTKNLKPYVLIILIIFTICVTASFFVIDHLQDDDVTSITTGYAILNLRGDTVDTWRTWKVLDDQLFHVHIVDSSILTDDMTQAIFDVIMSPSSLEIDDSLLHKGPVGHSSVYYDGWYGALNSISSETFYPIPKKLHFHVTDKGEGHILINLTPLSSPDGYSGYTTSIVDESSNQILKSTITIYNADKLSAEGLKTIVRHELGHAFGLAHSSATEDLMAPEITTTYPYISECDLDALVALYDGSEENSVVCEI